MELSCCKVSFFLLPRRVTPRTRKLFAGNLDHYEAGSVQTFLDLQGNAILVKRDTAGLNAFSSTCPHLGCHVYWEAEKQRFFCPCHNGVFNADGVAVSGPPAVIQAAETKGPAMKRKYERKVQEHLAKEEPQWLKGLKPEEAEALKKMYEQRYNQ